MSSQIRTDKRNCINRLATNNLTNIEIEHLICQIVAINVRHNERTMEILICRLLFEKA